MGPRIFHPRSRPRHVAIVRHEESNASMGPRMFIRGAKLEAAQEMVIDYMLQ